MNTRTKVTPSANACMGTDVSTCANACMDMHASTHANASAHANSNSYRMDGLLSSASRFFGGAAHRIIVAGTAGALALTLAACGGTNAVTGEFSLDEQAAQSVEVTQDSADTDVATDAEDASAADKDVDWSEFSIDASTLFSNRDLDASYDENAATKVSLADDGSQVDGSGVNVHARLW